MANVPQRWSPALGGLGQLQRELDDLFERMLGRSKLTAQPTYLQAPEIESYVEKGVLVVRADLPGLDPKDVEISVIANHLVIRGHRESKQEAKGRDYYHREVFYGSFERSIPLPEGIRAEQVKSSYRHGVLEVTLPLPKEAMARKVPITAKPEPVAKSERSKKKR